MTRRDRLEIARLTQALGAARAQLAQDKAPTPAPKKIRAIGPNAGLTAWLERRLQAEIEAMSRSVIWWTRAAYRKQLEAIEPPQQNPKFALDAQPADLLARVLAALREKWGNRFDTLAKEIATTFAKRAGKTTDHAIEAALRAAEFRVTFQITPAQTDQVAAAVQQGVSLIRSIPEQYFVSVEGAVMRSVQAGRDLGTLTAELEASYGVTHRRAAVIARHQNNIATAMLNRVRQLEIGVERAVWIHAGASKEPRASHVAQSGKEYDVRTGWWDPDAKQFCWPGSLINCRCKSRSIIPGLDVGERKEAA